MKQKLLSWFLLFCAVGLSLTAAYYSVMGLSILFASVAIPVIIMGSFLELSKIAITTYLHDQWKKTYTMLKVYLTTALVILSFITSLGIYGLLTTGFQENISKLEIGGKEVANVQLKRDRFNEIKKEYTLEKTTLDKDISQLRNALSTNTTTQTVDKKTGQVISKANTGNRKAFESQLTLALENKTKTSTKIEALNDSLTNLDIQVLNMESKSQLGNELGAIKYVSELTGTPIKKTANIFILLIIFVFDPLAIILVIATNQSFNNLKPKLNIYGEPKPTLITQEYQPNPAIEQEKQNIIEEINKIQNSNRGSSSSRSSALNNLNNKLSSLNDDNTKTY
jgi:hypothetical protein